MAMERSSLAALLLLTLVLAASSSSGGGSGDDAAAAVEEKKQKQCNPRAVKAHPLVSFYNKGGEEIRLLADKGGETLSPSGFANRSGHWFYRHRRHFPKPNDTSASQGSRTDAEGFWNTLAALPSGGDPDPAADDDEQQGYMLVGMQTSGGDKIRVAVVAGESYFVITGFAKGWFRPPNWFFRDGERHRLVMSLGGNESGSHAEVVASNVLAALIKGGKAFCG